MYVRHKTKLDRLLYNTYIDNSCWLWQGIINEAGYGKLKVSKRWVKAHRYSYELFVGDIPEGLTLDHLCRNRSCVNPGHLEPVTLRENVLRGAAYRYGKQYA